jgi:hypothetical protein
MLCVKALKAIKMRGLPAVPLISREVFSIIIGCPEAPDQQHVNRHPGTLPSYRCSNTCPIHGSSSGFLLSAFNSYQLSRNIHPNTWLVNRLRIIFSSRQFSSYNSVNSQRYK